MYTWMYIILRALIRNSQINMHLIPDVYFGRKICGLILFLFQTKFGVTFWTL